MQGKLRILKSHNRPYVSNDNPFSESRFKSVRPAKTLLVMVVSLVVFRNLKESA